ncbi:hypothetical protein DFJ74DRAFT_694746 [Hyaloraphidium curvatum]|nr:hypothetical protein DFJ74DRAFT_694746 [Hyaloraphidium curvatum]
MAGTHVDPASLPWHGIPPPPSPDATVSVSFLLNGVLRTNKRLFVNQAADEQIECPVFGALIEKKLSTGVVDRIVWDPGCRKDVEGFPPAPKKFALKAFEPIHKLDVADNLAKGGLSTADVGTVAISHSHFDHIGDPLLFPSSTVFITGDIAVMGKGYPEDKYSSVHTKEITSHRWELAHGGGREWKPVGAFDRGIDWYGDGSFWILDAPGHMPGHLVAMARTTAGTKDEPPTYLIMAGDAAHSLCLFHPWPSPSGGDSRCKVGHYGPGFTTSGPDLSQCIHIDLPEAYRTMARLSRMDAEANVMVTVAHETELMDIVVFFPEATANGWKAGGWKEKRAEAARKSSRKDGKESL